MSVLYPKSCVLCGMPLQETGKAQICPACAREVRRNYRSMGEIILPPLNGGASPLCYHGMIAQALKRFKFRGANECAAWFAAQMAVALAPYLTQWQPDCLTFVPLGFWRAHQRGYNQSELLAREVARQLKLPCEPLLRKRPFVKRQSAMQDDAAREKNIEDAFVLRSGATVADRRIVLVDDIITSGATLRQAAKPLFAAGADAVYALSAAYAGGKRKQMP